VLVLAEGLSTGHKIGLFVVAAVFIGFALAASFLAPRRWPDFPGKHGMSPFIIASFVLFFGMLAAVYVFGKESEPAEASSAQPESGKPASHTIKVTEAEWKVQVPAQTELTAATYTFDVHNAGKIPHDFVVTRGSAPGGKKTPLIKPGADAKLIVSLTSGNYTLYCSVPGHRQLGMVAKLSVG
jgi:plastocyanin